MLFYGFKDVNVLWYGEWSDPMVEYNGITINYWDLEDYLYNSYKEDGEIGEFDDYVLRNELMVIDYFYMIENLCNDLPWWETSR